MSVTVAIPFYNAETFLEDAIRSVFAQTYQEWELLLIDDGSTDNSLQIAKSIKDTRVRVFSDGKNKKLAARLNEVPALAKYNYIARMDADDLMSPNRIKKQIDFLQKHSEFDLISCGNYSLDNDCNVKGVRWHFRENINLNDLLNKKGSGILHAAILAKKSWYKRNKYNEELATAQDYDLWVRAAAAKDLNIFLMQEALYYYREEGNVRSGKLFRALQVERSKLRTYKISGYRQLIFKSYLKTLIVLVLKVFNKTNLLLKRRSFKLSPSIKYKTQYELEVIRNTKIPGIDEN